MTYPLASISNAEAGSSVRTKLNQIITDSSHIKNVKDFGATGDGSTDDHASIQAAVNYATSPSSAQKKGIIYFPLGTYNISQAIAHSGDTADVEFLGAPGASIIGNFDGYLIDINGGAHVSGSRSIRNLRLTNSHATAGKAIRFKGVVGGLIENCAIGAWRGIETFNSQSVEVRACSLISAAASGSVGIMAGNATSIFSTDISAYEHGIRHHNNGLIVHGGRMEVNTIAIVLGEDDTGNPFNTSSFDICGVSMESNQTSLWVRTAVAGRVSFNCGGGVQLTRGILVSNGSDIQFSGISCSSSIGFTSAVYDIDAVARCTFENMTNSNGTSGWSFANGMHSFRIANCDNPPFDTNTLPTNATPGTTFEVDDASSPSIGSDYTGGSSTAAVVMKKTGSGYSVAAL